MIDKNILKAVRIEPGEKVRLKDHDTRWPNGGFGGELDTWSRSPQGQKIPTGHPRGFRVGSNHFNPRFG